MVAALGIKYGEPLSIAMPKGAATAGEGMMQNHRAPMNKSPTLTLPSMKLRVVAFICAYWAITVTKKG